MSDYLVPVFDLGGVFIDWNPMYLFRKLFDTEEDAQWFHDHVCTSLWNIEFDAGKSYAEGIQEKTNQFPQYFEQISAFDRRWHEMISGLIEGTIDIQNELIEAEIPTFAITNFSREKFHECLEKYEFLRKFDGIVVSGNERLIKPDYRIFHRLLDRYSLAPDQCVLIDDSFPNVTAARYLGMKAVHFENPAQARKELIEFGLPLKAA
ncbi:HAD family hydrolase [Maritalea sp.]|jgi:FMN phosphatase YigB (HAD superfamily)|uniref:HAD family hydrolase n=1 Tax=Maritalea sp. TaxID=2003361 RepID=UPI0039E29515